MTLLWKHVPFKDSPREHAAASQARVGWVWVAYPTAETRWKLQLLRADLSEYPLPDVAYESFEDALARVEEIEAVFETWCKENAS